MRACGKRIVVCKGLADYNIPFELHVFQDGAHGLSLANHAHMRTNLILNHLQNPDGASCKWLWNLFGKGVPEKELS